MLMPPRVSTPLLWIGGQNVEPLSPIIPTNDDERVPARHRLELSSPHRSPDHAVRGKVQNEIRPPTCTATPGIERTRRCRQRRTDDGLGRCAIRIRRCARNVRLSAEAIPELVVRLSDVTDERVAAHGFVSGEIVAG